MTDCLLIGPNDMVFEEYVKTLKSMGVDSGGFKELDLAFVELDGKPYHGLGVLNRFRAKPCGGTRAGFSNVDFLWPVILVLGSFLSKHGHSFDYVNLFQQDKERLRRKLEDGDIRAVAVTTTLYVSVEPILEVVNFIRKHNRTAKVIVGGPYIMNQAQVLDPDGLRSLFDYVGADVYVISAEGELALANTLTALKNGGSLASVDNIAYRENGQFVRTHTFREANPLEENMVDYSLFPASDFGEFVTLRTAKSCPFQCAFCGFPQRAGEYTYLDVEHVESKLNAIRDIGTVNTLTIVDDSFNAPMSRYKDIMRMMIRNDYGFKWNSYLRCDHADEECVALMKDSGCEGVFIGMESGSAEMLRRMNKTARPDDYLRIVPLLRDAGILSHGNVIVGFPGETYETVQESVDLLEETGPDFYKAQLWYCDPTTPICQRRDEFRLHGSAFNWSHNTMDVATAADLVDKLFLGIENSIWLPQFGFEMWSVFLLQRRGVPLDRIKMYMRCFNAAVKRKLLEPASRACTGPLLESLEASCRLESLAPPDMAPVERLSGAAYRAAEQHWVGEFGNSEDGIRGRRVSGNLDHVRDGDAGGPTRDDDWDSTRRSLGAPQAERLVAGYGDRVHEVALAAFSTLLARWTGCVDMALLAAFQGNGGPSVVPLRLRVPWELPFEALVNGIRDKVSRALEHREFAFHILTNQLRLNEHGMTCPLFEIGCTFHETEAQGDGRPLDEALSGHPGVWRAMDLTLDVYAYEQPLALTVSWRKHAFLRETMEEVGDYLVEVLDEMLGAPAPAADGGARDGDEGDTELSEGTPGTGDVETVEDFDFT